ncbi:hypothetical protein ScPMuIL_015131 [Solemya velum]
MRIYLRKFVLWSVTFCIGFLLTFNVYNHDVWVYDDPGKSWAPKAQETRNNKRNSEWGSKIKVQTNNSQIRTNKNTIRIVEDNITITLRPLEKNEKNSIKQNLLLFPSLERYEDDRILAQMKHRPKHIIEHEKKKEKVPMKTIFMNSGLRSAAERGQARFLADNCPTNQCILTDDKNKASDADAIVFHQTPSPGPVPRPKNQVWILFMLESPYHTPGLGALNNVINWTATYRHDSVIVAPYEKFVPFNESVPQKTQVKNYALGKTKHIAWFVSNCGARNGRRKYADELAKYIDVDIYGTCGPLTCPRSKADECFGMLNRDYKFYLAFENSNCRDYITEKYFVTGLQNDVIPIVMGAAPEDYKRASPPHSYIHVDDFESPKELAEYLHKLDKNDDLYNEYFLWKGTGSFVNTFFYCRLCAMVHEVPNNPPTIYHNLDRWWRGPGVCIDQQNWRSRKNMSSIIIDHY